MTGSAKVKTGAPAAAVEGDDDTTVPARVTMTEMGTPTPTATGGTANVMLTDPSSLDIEFTASTSDCPVDTKGASGIGGSMPNTTENDTPLASRSGKFATTSDAYATLAIVVKSGLLIAVAGPCRGHAATIDGGDMEMVLAADGVLSWPATDTKTMRFEPVLGLVSHVTTESLQFVEREWAPRNRDWGDGDRLRFVTEELSLLCGVSYTSSGMPQAHCKCWRLLTRGQ